MELKIVDEEDRPLAPEERGEIVVKGPAVMKEYLNLPDETADAVRCGWLHTGDIGYLDKEGYLYIVDRKKDMILRAGENIYPGKKRGESLNPIKRKTTSAREAWTLILHRRKRVF